MPVRRLSILAALAVPLLIAACGSSGSDEPDSASTDAGDTGVMVEDVERIPSEPPADGDAETVPASPAAPPEPAPEVSLADFLIGEPGEDVAIVPGGSDYTLGENRVTFLVLRSDASQVLSPAARVLIGRVDAELPELDAPDGFGGTVGQASLEIDATTIDATPIAESQAELLTIGTEAGRAAAAAAEAAGEPFGDIDLEHLYVARVDFAEPGVYWVIAEPEGEAVQAFGILQVRADPIAPAIGEQAPPTENPTLDDARARAITTQRPPAVELLRYSVKQSLEASAPFVVTLATPEFCISRVCGPVVDVLEEVRSGFESTDIRFIQIEIYRENNPTRGINEWVQEWGIPSEPWTFVVDETGVIRDRFEGAFSSEELRDSVNEHLVGA